MKKFLICLFSIFMVLSLSACGTDAESVSTAGELTRKLESKSDKKIAISEDIVLTETIEIVGNKEIVGSGTITVSVADMEESYVIGVADGARLTIGGGATIDLSGLTGGIHVKNGATLVLQEEAVVTGASVKASNVLVEGSFTMNGGLLQLANGHNLINKNKVTIAGGKIKGSGSGYVAVYNEGTFTQDDGAIVGAYNNVVCASASSFTWNKGEIKTAVGDAIIIEEGASIHITSSDAKLTDVFSKGLIVNGEGVIDGTTMTDSMSSMIEVGHNGKLTINNGKISEAGVHGIDNAGELLIAGGIIYDNRESGVCNTGTFEMTGGSIMNSENKGVLNKAGTAKIVSEDVILSGNKFAIGNEEGAYFELSKAQLIQSATSNIFAYGGEMYIHDIALAPSASTNTRVIAAKLIMEDVEIQGVSESADGGSHGIYMEGGAITAENLIIRNTTGNALRNKGGNFQGEDITIQDIKGVAIGCMNQAETDREGIVNIKNATTKNVQNNNVFVESGTCTLTNVTLGACATNNVKTQDGTLILKKCTVNGNTAQGNGSNHAVYMVGGTIKATNTKFQNATGAIIRTSGEEAFFYGKKLTFKNSKVFGIFQTDGNIFIDDLTTSNMGQNNIMMDKGVIELTNATLGATTSNNIRLRNSGKIVLNDVEIQGHVEGTKNSEHVLFPTNGTLIGKNLYIHDAAGSAVRVNGEDVKVTLEDVEIDGATIAYNLTQGEVTIKNTSTKNVKENNVMTWYENLNFTMTDAVLGETESHNVRIQNGITHLENIDIQGVKENSKGDYHGIFVSKGTVTGENITISDVDAVAVRVNDEANVTFDGVEIKEPGSHGVFVNAGKTEITNMTTKGVPEFNIWINEGGGLKVKDSVLGKTASHNVRVNGGTTTFENVDIKGTLEGREGDFHGLYINKGTISGKNITISDIDASAVRVNGEADVKLDGVEIKNPGMYGVFVNAGKTEIANMTTTDIPVHNIYINADGNLKVKDSVLGKAESHNVKVEGGTTYFENVALNGTSESKEGDFHGLYVTKGAVSGKKVAISDIDASAVRVNGDADVKLDGVEIKNPGMYGVFVNAGKTEIANMTTTDVPQHNIWINEAGSLSVKDSVLCKTENHNVQINGGITSLENVDVQGTLEGSEGDYHGIIVSKGAITGKNITISDADVAAVHVNGDADVKLDGVTIENPGFYGVHVKAGKTEIANMTTTGVQANNIWSTEKANLTVKDSVLGKTKSHNVKINSCSEIYFENVDIQGIEDEVTGDIHGLIVDAGSVSGKTIKISDVKGAAIRVSGGEFTANDVEIGNVDKYGAFVSGGVTEITGMKTTGVKTHNVWSNSNADLTLIDSVLGKTGSHNVWMQDGTLALEGVKVEGTTGANDRHGLLLQNGTTTVDTLTIKGTAGSAVRISGGSMTGNDVTIGSEEATIGASGIAATGGTVDLETVTFNNVNNFNVQATDTNSASVTLKKATLNASKGAYNVILDGDSSNAKIVLTDSSVIGRTDGGNDGVYAKSGTVELNNVTASGYRDGVRVLIPATAILNGVTATGTTGYGVYNLSENLKLKGVIKADIYNNAAVTVNATASLAGSNMTVDWPLDKLPHGMVGMQFVNAEDAQGSNTVIALGSATSEKYVKYFDGAQMLLVDRNAAVYTVKNYSQLVAAIAHMQNNNITDAIITVAGNIAITEEVTIPANVGVTLTDDGTERTISRGSDYTGNMFSVSENASLIVSGANLVVDGSSANVEASNRVDINVKEVSAELSISGSVIANVSHAKGSKLYVAGALTDDSAVVVDWKSDIPADCVGLEFATEDVSEASEQYISLGNATLDKYYLKYVGTTGVLIGIYEVDTLGKLNSALTAINGTPNKIGLIRVVGNITVDSTITIPAGCNVTIEDDGTGTARSLNRGSGLTSTAMIQLGNGATLTLQSSGKIVEETSGNTVTETGCKLILDGKNIVSDNGKATPLILLDDEMNAKVNIGKGVKLQNNESKGVGGVVRAKTNGGTINVDGAYFVNNKATGNGGGAIGLWSGNVTTIKNAVFKNNTAGTNGGAIYTESGSAEYKVTIQNTRFEENEALTTNCDGGAIYINPKAVFEITDCKFANNKAERAGGAICVRPSGAKLILKGASENTIFSGNSGREGGAIAVGNSSTLSVNGYTFNGNTATNAGKAAGGAIWLNVAQAEITDTTFINNTSEKDGGAVYAKGNSKLTLNASAGSLKAKFEGNTASGKGSAIYLTASTLNCSGYTFNNPAYSEAVVAENDSTSNYTPVQNVATFTELINALTQSVIIRLTDNISVDSTITIPEGCNVTIEDDGTGTARSLERATTLKTVAMIQLGSGATLTLQSSGEINEGDNGETGCKLILDGKNIVPDNGKATPLILLDDEMNATVNIGKGVKLQNNESKGVGGVVRAKTNGGTINVDGAYFVNNKATGNGGGAIGLWSGNVTTIKNAVFKNNTAGTNGGAIYTESGSAEYKVTIQNTRFEENEALTTNCDGGAIYINPKAVFEITDCKFANNKAERAGGAICVRPSGAKLILKGASENTIFSGNSGREGGAIAVGNSSTLSVNGYTFNGNTATNAGKAAGGAIWLNVAQAEITDTTFINNTSEKDGGAVYAKGNSKLTLNASTAPQKAKFEGNTATGKGSAIYLTASTLDGSGYTFTPAASESIVAESSTSSY